MARDRRFGLPHPLDVETPEDASPRRRPGLWESLKRALAASEPEPPRAESPRAESRSPLPPATPAAPDAAPVGDRTSAPARVAVPGAADAPIPGEVPFLSDSAPSRSSNDAAAPVPATNAVPPEAVRRARPESPAGRLARGLVSFSRENAIREKKFGHLLRGTPVKEHPPGTDKLD